MRNAITIDLEDYIHVTAFSDHITSQDWDGCVSRLEHNADKLLRIFDAHGTKATFFVLGWVARKYPEVIRRIADSGHEIACHSMWHRLVYELSPEEFREDTATAKQILEDITGKRVYGYRAPSFSITKASWWAFEVLAELGFTYDSSIFPVNHPNYGLFDAPCSAFSVDTPAGAVAEFPMPTLRIGRRRAPIGGGAYLRILPYWYTRWGLRAINSRENRPVCVYLHPWELDTEQPRMNASLTARVRHYIGLTGTEKKLRNLLRDFEFVPLIDIVGNTKANPTSRQLQTETVALRS